MDPLYTICDLFNEALGIAACNIGGVTIHSFAGIGLGIESAEDLVTKIKKNKKASTRWLRTKVLIIDEGQYAVITQHVTLEYSLVLVSMLDGVLFDKLAKIGSILRKRPEPFGGIQVSIYIILFGHILFHIRSL